MEFVDATVFLGMNSSNDALRLSCVAFFAARLDGRLAMSYEQVGRCDDIIWGYSRELQDAYYPFMDNLHTDLRFDRLAYDDRDIKVASMTDGLAAPESLLLAMVQNRGGTLVSLNPRLLSLADVPVNPPPLAADASFSGTLDELYQVSLALRVDVSEL